VDTTKRFVAHFLKVEISKLTYKDSKENSGVIDCMNVIIEYLEK